MDNIPQVTVVRGCRVTHDGVDLGRVGNWQLGTRVKPERGFGRTTALPGEGTDDRGGRNPGAQGGAGKRARDEHGGVIDALRGEIGIGNLREKLSQRAGNGHGNVLSSWCCARLLRRAHYPRQFGGGGGIQLGAVRSTQFGAGGTVVVTDHTMLQTGYGLPLSCTRQRRSLSLKLLIYLHKKCTLRHYQSADEVANCPRTWVRHRLSPRARYKGETHA